MIETFLSPLLLYLGIGFVPFLLIIIIIVLLLTR